jgi:thiamine pyrophosphokinase
MNDCALVLTGGGSVDAGVRARVPDDALVIAADSGLQLAAPLGVRVDRIVGDLDSVDRNAVDAAVAAGAVLERHPREKDATDLELAIDAAAREGAHRIVVVGGAGGRLDHVLANVLLLTASELTHLGIEAHFGDAHVAVVAGGRGQVELHGAPGSLVTLLPAGGPARGVVTEGLRYPLARETLPPGTTRGMSNVMLAAKATVALDEGTLLAIQPDGGGVPS